MTHDELLAKIKNNGTLETELVCTCPHKEVVEIETRPHRNDKALSAVVEATQLENPAPISPAFGDGWRTAMLTVFAAIEKELK